MKRTEVSIPNYNYLSIGNHLTFMGSCFSEHMAEVSSHSGFNMISNPFGVVFNPISLANLILFEEDEWIDSIFQQDDKFLSWNAHSAIWSLEKEKLEAIILKNRSELFDHIKKSNTLFVTFGSSWVYELDPDKVIVANCHKAPQHHFKKRCLETHEIVAAWNKVLVKLNELNPALQLVLTVSPVRHIKDGLVENNLSKSRLISAVHELCKAEENVDYFPSYEILIDELRDYAYFDSDGVHPNNFAIKALRERFFNSFLTREAKVILKEFESLKKLLSHKTLHEGSRAAEEFIKMRAEKKAEFLIRYPAFHSELK